MHVSKPPFKPCLVTSVGHHNVSSMVEQVPVFKYEHCVTFIKVTSCISVQYLQSLHHVLRTHSFFPVCVCVLSPFSLTFAAFPLSCALALIVLFLPPSFPLATPPLVLPYSTRCDEDPSVQVLYAGPVQAIRLLV
eukprot:m.12709 g.12709  ORF g.12709 m.12709 type:complete len:135 (-) comp5857_c0_seq2:1303-1707(-)